MEVYLLYGDSGEYESYSQLQGIYLTLEGARKSKDFLERKFKEYQAEVAIYGFSYELYEKHDEKHDEKVEAYSITINDCRHMSIETHIVKE